MDQDHDSSKLVPHIADFGLSVIVSGTGVNGMEQDHSIGMSNGYAGISLL